MTLTALAGETGRVCCKNAPECRVVIKDLPFQAERHRVRDARHLCSLIEGLEGGACQSMLWLECWFSIFGHAEDVEIFVLLLRDREGRTRLAMPLVRRMENGLRILEAMDHGVTDYVAPLIRREGSEDLSVPEAVWPMIGKVLPEADVLRLDRLAPRVAGMENPLFSHPRARLNRLAGWASPEITAWDDYFGSLSPKQRDNSGKNRRRFLRQPGTSIRFISTVEEGMAALARLDAFQKERVGEKGLEYCLDRPDIAAFYRALVEGGIVDGRVLIGEMRAGEEVVAVNFAVLNGREAIYLRVGNQFGEWSKMSPGVMITEIAIEEAVRRGVRTFDFGMGDYIYKRRLGAKEYPLRDLVLPLSLRGAPYALLWHARSWAARNPLVRRLTGRAPASTGADSAAA